MEDIIVELPEEYSDKGFLNSVKTEDGQINLNKLLKKVENQESILGKRALPNHDSTEEEMTAFEAKMAANFYEEDFAPAVEGLDTVAATELRNVCKAAGMTPNQAKKLVAAHKKLVEAKYSPEDFKNKLESKTTPELAKAAKDAMGEERWNATLNMMNDNAIETIITVGTVAQKYNVTEATTGAGIQNVETSPEDMQQKYWDEMREIAKRGGTQAEKDACMKKYKVLEIK